MRELEFKFGGDEVGYLEEPAFPKAEGRYRYVPYRGPGHYEMAQEMTARGSAVIVFDDEGIVRRARAREIEYGVLELSDFSVEPPSTTQK